MGLLDTLVLPFLLVVLTLFVNDHYQDWKSTWPVKIVRDPPQYQEYIVIREKELKELKELFDRFPNHDNTVNGVYLFGIPGSGKTEIARQYGNFAYEKHGVCTVITLNVEGTSDEFRETLLEVLKEIHKYTIEQIDLMQRWNMRDLMNELRQLLQKRHGWLLIVDNIRDPNITQKELYNKLPRPGTDKWGTGMMLVTTQVPLHHRNSAHIRIKNTNDGLTQDDAAEFLCGLVTMDHSSRVCDKEVATEIVIKLERLPLSIFAAGIFIESRLHGLYSIDNYLVDLKSLGVSHEQDLKPTESEYSHSMLAALQLTIEETIKVNSDELPADVFLDFIALIGYAAGEAEGTISSLHVEEYFKMRGRDPKHFPKPKNFPLVDFWEEKKCFWAHQVVRYAFRAALERSGMDLLLYTFGNISHYLVMEYKSNPDNWRIVEKFQYFVENLPSQYCHQNSCIIPSGKYVNDLILLFFTSFDWWIDSVHSMFGSVIPSPSPSFCPVLDTFLIRLCSIRLDNPNSVSPLKIFKGYQRLYRCYKWQDEKQSMVATRAIDVIKEIAPERFQLHTVVASTYLILDLGSTEYMRYSIKNEVFHSFLCSKTATDMYFRVRDIRRVVDYFQKLVLSLSELCDEFQLTPLSFALSTNNINYIVQTLISISKMASTAVHIESVATIMSQCFISYYDNKAIIHDKKLPNELHIGLGRRYQLGQYGIKQSYVSGKNPYGACSSKQVYTVKDFAPSLIFYIDYDIRIGLKNTEISVFNKYFEVFKYFIPMLREFKTILHKLIFTQENSELKEIICQDRNDQFYKLREILTWQTFTWRSIDPTMRRIKLPFRDKILLFNDHLLCVSISDEFLLNYVNYFTFVPGHPLYTTIHSGNINTIDRIRRYVYNDAMAFSIRELLCYQRPEEATEILLEIFDAIMYAFRLTIAD